MFQVHVLQHGTVLPKSMVLTIPLPGAKISAHDPQFENDDLALALVDAATTIALGKSAVLHVSAFSFPAAAAIEIPFDIALLMAFVNAVDGAPPRDMLITDGRVPCFALWRCMMWSMPAMTVASVPPCAFNTLTPCKRTCFATPNVVPPTVPAQCVPWPSVSWQDSPEKALNWHVARLPNWTCDVLIPVSRT